MSSKYESAFKSAIADSERKICIELLRQNPDMTLGDLQKLSKGSLASIFAEITLGELLSGEGARSKAPARPLPARPVAGKPRPAVPEARGRTEGAEVDVRTPAGRAAYEAALLAALGEFTEPTGVAVLMRKVGGTNLQARAALNRLIESGKITWIGKARGTKYSVARQ